MVISHIILGFHNTWSKGKAELTVAWTSKKQAAKPVLGQLFCNGERFPEEPVKGTLAKCAIKKHIELATFALGYHAGTGRVTKYKGKKKITCKRTKTSQATVPALLQLGNWQELRTSLGT